MKDQIPFMRWTWYQPLKDALHILSLPLLQVSQPELLNGWSLHITEWRSYSSLVPLEQQTGLCRHRLPCLNHSKTINHSTKYAREGMGLIGLSMIPCWPQAIFLMVFCCVWVCVWLVSCQQGWRWILSRSAHIYVYECNVGLLTGGLGPLPVLHRA